MLLLGCAAASRPPRPADRRAHRRRASARRSSGGRSPDRDRARAAGHLVGQQVAARQRPRGRPAAGPAGDRRQLHDLVPRRLAKRGRHGRRDGPGPPVRAPDVHPDEERPAQRLRHADGGGGRQLERDDLLRLHRLRGRRAARGGGHGRPSGGRPDGQPGPAQKAGRDRARRRRRGEAVVGRGQRRRDPGRADVPAGVQEAPLPLAGHRPHEGHQGLHAGERRRLLPEVLRPEQRRHRRGRQDRRSRDAGHDRGRVRGRLRRRRSCRAATPRPNGRPPPRSAPPSRAPFPPTGW